MNILNNSEEIKVSSASIESPLTIQIVRGLSQFDNACVCRRIFLLFCCFVVVLFFHVHEDFPL